MNDLTGSRVRGLQGLDRSEPYFTRIRDAGLPPMPRYSSEHSEKTYRRILDATGTVVRTRGFSGGLRGMMDAIGMTRGAVYHHFGSKDRLLVKTLEDIFEANRKLWTERLGDLRGPQRIARMLDLYLSEIHAGDVEGGCAIPSVLSDLSRVDPVLRKPFETYYAWLIDEISAHIDEENARTRASGVLAAAFGGLATARAVADPATRQEILNAANNAARLLCGAPPLERRT